MAKGNSGAKKGKTTTSAVDFFGLKRNRMDTWNALSTVAEKLARARAAGRDTAELETRAQTKLDDVEIVDAYWAYPGALLSQEVRASSIGASSTPSRARSRRSAAT